MVRLMDAPIETLCLYQFYRALCLCLLLVVQTCIAGNRHIGQIYPGFEGSRMDWIDQDGIFLLSKNYTFGLGFASSLEGTSCQLAVLHMDSHKGVWTANKDLFVGNSDKFVFDLDGNAYLSIGNEVIWSTGISGQGGTAMELWDNGNLVVLGKNKEVLWQSFSHPTDTILPGQELLEGMKLSSFRNSHNLVHFLEIKSGDVILYAGFQPPQIYWSMANESRKTIEKVGGKVYSASLMLNSWNFYDKHRTLIWQFNFSENSDPNAFWSVVLRHAGSISFYNLQKGKSVIAEPIKIPQKSCSLPEPCDPYNVCGYDSRCQCPHALSSLTNCRPQTISTCNNSTSSVKLLLVGDRLSYFSLRFLSPTLKADINGCKKACLSNCSCLVLFSENSSGNCFLFNEIGSFQHSDVKSSGFTSYLKVMSSGNDGFSSGEEERKKERKHVLEVVIIAVATSVVIFLLLCLGFWYYKKKQKLQETYQCTLEDDSSLEGISGMPVRFSYNELQIATNNFSVKVGQGGFGSVYQGVLPDGTQLAVKKLERIGQGMKEFRAEVSIIGSIHHIHLVKLRGFCAEGLHRLLVYEYMGKGSLDRWIFNKNEEAVLEWETRFSIALGMAKGLAYLHEECEEKIVHCDIKPENVLLDDNYLAKVSDFGLAKLMNREQSHVFTTLRGTRGYLAPEWITNYAISEKSDVYSYGMVLLEIIGGRKNYEPEETSEVSHLPSYAFKMMEEGKPKEILDPKLDIDQNDHRVINAIKVALWCIQDEMYLRPPMTKVVQMLEGVCEVPQPPTSSLMRSRLYTDFFKWSSEEGDKLQAQELNSAHAQFPVQAHISTVQPISIISCTKAHVS